MNRTLNGTATYDRVLFLGASGFIAARAIAVVMALITLGVLARSISPAEFGALAICLAVQTLYNVSLEGFLNGVVVTPGRVPRASLLRTLAATSAWTVLFASVVMFVAAPLASKVLGMPLLLPLLVWSTPVLVLRNLTLCGHALLQRSLRISQSAAITLASNSFIYSAAAIALAAMGWRAYSVPVGMTVAVFSELLLILWAGKQLIAGRINEPDVMPTPWKLGLQGASSRIWNWASSTVDTFIVASTQSMVSLGVYNRAYSLLVQAKEPFEIPARRVVLPVLSKLSGQSDDFREILTFLVCIYLAAAVFGAFILATNAEILVTLLLGPSWHATAEIVSVLFLGLPFRVAYTLFEAALVAAQKGRRLNQVSIDQFLLIASLTAAGSLFGSMGIAGGLVTAYGVYYLHVLIAATRELNLSPTQLFKSHVPSILAASVFYAAYAGLPSSGLGTSDPFDVVMTMIFAMSVGILLTTCLPETWLDNKSRGYRVALTRIFQARLGALIGASTESKGPSRN